MKIKKKKNSYVACFSKKDPPTTWRQVRDFCNEKILALDSSKEAKDIESIKFVISFLQSKVDSFYKKRELYVKMASCIKDSDSDIDEILNSKEE